MKRLVALFAVVAASPIALAVMVPAATGGTSSAPSEVALAEIPADLLTVYMGASTSCPGLPWQVLAAIGSIESDHAHDTVDPTTGETSPPIYGPPLDGSVGVALIRDPTQPGGYARAAGPMQFLTTTWARWGRVAPDRPPDAVPDIQNAWDAIYTAAAYLCGGQDALADLDAAILRYNHSDDYLRAVLAKAEAYGLGGPRLAADDFTGSGDAVVAVAMTQIGVPYVWGGSSPDVGFDCSGLVQWAYAQIGVDLPRTTSQQVLAGVPVTELTQLRPGDLIFTNSNRGGTIVAYGHVTIYAGGGMQIAAPRTGDVVKLQPVPANRVVAARRVLAAP